MFVGCPVSLRSLMCAAGTTFCRLRVRCVIHVDCGVHVLFDCVPVYVNIVYNRVVLVCQYNRCMCGHLSLVPYTEVYDSDIPRAGTLLCLLLM